MTVGENYIHQIVVKDTAALQGVAARIEGRLGVRCEIVLSHGKYNGYPHRIIFQAPRHVDLDFLRPDVLPPR